MIFTKQELNRLVADHPEILTTPVSVSHYWAYSKSLVAQARFAAAVRITFRPILDWTARLLNTATKGANNV